MENNSKLFPRQELINLSQTSVLLLILTFLAWYVKYHWRRITLYKIVKQPPGLVTLPFLGNALYFLTAVSDSLRMILNIVRKFDSPLPVWLGNKLHFFIWEPKDLKIILNSPHALEKDDLYKFVGVGALGLLIAPVPLWKRHRKMIAPTFKQKNLDGFVDVFAQKCEVLVQQLDKEVGKGAFDVFPYINRYTLDVICDAAMGVTFHAQTTEVNFLKWVSRGMEITYKRMVNVFYRSDFLFKLSPLFKEGRDLAKKGNSFIEAIVKKKREAYREKMKEDKKDYVSEEPRMMQTLLQILIELSENGEYITDEEVRDEIATFIVGGSDTVASVESFTFIMLGMYPNIQQKVYEEIIDVLGFDRPAQPEDLRRFRYMEKVIKETMRLFPVAPIISRAVTQDIKLDKCIIPAGSSVAICKIGVHWNPEIWPDPFKFDPDRFLPEKVTKRHPYSWLPFSGGPRNCIGKKFACMSMKTTIATVLRRYRFHTEYRSIEDMKLKANIFLKPSRGYSVSVELRR